MKQLVQLTKNRRIYLVLSVVAALSMFMAWITFDYWDLDSMTAWTMNFWDLFFEGRLGEFYEYTTLNLHGAQHYNCEGNYLWLLPWCLWNLPLWLIKSGGGYLPRQQCWESALV